MAIIQNSRLGRNTTPAKFRLYFYSDPELGRVALFYGPSSRILKNWLLSLAISYLPSIIPDSLCICSLISYLASQYECNIAYRLVFGFH